MSFSCTFDVDGQLGLPPDRAPGDRDPGLGAVDDRAPVLGPGQFAEPVLRARNGGVTDGWAEGYPGGQAAHPSGRHAAGEVLPADWKTIPDQELDVLHCVLVL